MDIEGAVKSAIFQVEKYFLENFALDRFSIRDISGCCLVLCILVDSKAHVFKVGKGEAVLSFGGGQFWKQLTKSHAISTEYKRIKGKGGIVYQSDKISKDFNFPLIDHNGKVLFDKYKIYPSNLTVGRTIGDAEIKFDGKGMGNSQISCEPDYYSFEVTERDDYLVLLCDVLKSGRRIGENECRGSD